MEFDKKSSELLKTVMELIERLGDNPGRCSDFQTDLRKKNISKDFRCCSPDRFFRNFKASKFVARHF